MRYFVCFVFLIAGCATYHVPEPMEGHPACPEGQVCQVELTSILDIEDVDAVFQ